MTMTVTTTPPSALPTLRRNRPVLRPRHWNPGSHRIGPTPTPPRLPILRSQRTVRVLTANHFGGYSRTRPRSEGGNPAYRSSARTAFAPGQIDSGDRGRDGGRLDPLPGHLRAAVPAFRGRGLTSPGR